MLEPVLAVCLVTYWRRRSRDLYSVAASGDRYGSRPQDQTRVLCSTVRRRVESQPPTCVRAHLPFLSAGTMNSKTNRRFSWVFTGLLVIISAFTPRPLGGADPPQPSIQRAGDAPQPLSPSESAAKIQLPEGFRIELVASEPLIREPSCLAFDERNRIFVCELHGYNIEGHLDVTELNKTGVLDKQVRRIRWELRGGKIAEEAARRQFGVVKLLTDSDGDGVMDKATVWADDLPPCYGVLPAREGVIVLCAPHILYLADRDGDGRPEIRETLFTGFRTRVLERGINNPRWGLDNWIYIGGGGTGGTIQGPGLAQSVELGNTDFRIKADGSAIEPVTGRVGTFGLTINDAGDRFPSTGGRPATYALPLPHRYLTRNPYVATPETTYSAATYNRGFRISQPHPWRVKRQQDPAWVKFYGARETNSNFFSGGCSNEFYGDRLFPAAYRGNLFYCEPSLNIVHRCILQRSGAGYQGQRAANEQESEFLASTDQWFRPMNLRVGPEGALYIVDMYREIIEDYSAIPRFLQQQYGLDRGSQHGRIWRLVPTGPRPRAWVDFSQLNGDQLAHATADASLWRRLTAQRLLVERQDTSVAPLLAQQLRADVSPQACLHALYTLAGLGQLTSADVRVALQHAHYTVRLHALRLAEHWLDKDAQLVAGIHNMRHDTDPAVRLQLAMTMGAASPRESLDTLVTLAQKHGEERWMEAAILSSASDRSGGLLMRLLQSSLPSPGTRRLLEPLAVTIAARRDGPAMSRTLALLTTRASTSQALVLAGFVKGITRGKQPVPRTKDGWASLTRLLTSQVDKVRESATQLASHLPLANPAQLKAIFAEATGRALDDNSPLDQRRQAIHVMASASFDQLAPLAEHLLAIRQPLELQRAAMTALGASNDDRVAALLLEKWPGFTPELRNVALRTIFARSNRLAALLNAIEQEVVRGTELTAIERDLLLTHPDKQLNARAQRLLVNATATAELQRRIDTYQRALQNPRNVERGEQLFTKHCLSCHQLKDAGHAVGPRLGSTINRPDETILLDLLDPSGRIEPEYRSYTAITEDGRSFTGILASESPTSITLQKEKNATETLLRRDLEFLRASAVSLMPANLHEQLGPQDVADLIAFLRKAYGRGDQK